MRARVPTSNDPADELAALRQRVQHLERRLEAIANYSEASMTERASPLASLAAIAVYATGHRPATERWQQKRFIEPGDSRASQSTLSRAVAALERFEGYMNN